LGALLSVTIVNDQKTQLHIAFGPDVNTNARVTRIMADLIDLRGAIRSDPACGFHAARTLCTSEQPVFGENIDGEAATSGEVYVGVIKFDILLIRRGFGYGFILAFLIEHKSIMYSFVYH
jgi:hypothetical protein